MRTQTRILLGMTLAFAISAGPSSTRADFVEQTTAPQTQSIPSPTLDLVNDPPSVTLPQTDWTPATTFGGTTTNPLVFQKFDTAGGTRVLDSVNLVFSYRLDNQFAMTFTTPATITVTAADLHVELDRPGATAPGQSPLFNPTIANIPVTFSSTTPQTILFPSDPSKHITTEATLGPLTLASASDLASFSANGGGTIAFPAWASGSSLFTSSSGNGSGRVTTQAGVSLEVSYTYHTIPEPASFVLLGLGGAGLVVMLRSRRTAMSV
jgi:hypothetical protein